MNLRLKAGDRSMAAEPEYEVEIISEETIEIPTIEGAPRKEVWITYRYGRLPPGLIKIPVEKDTPEERARMIREDLKTALLRERKTLKV